MRTPLQIQTAQSWADLAVLQWRELLIDHANCEKKAASTALSIVFAYPDDAELAAAMSRIAREELRHFEQVQRLIVSLGVPFVRQKPGRYAGALRALMRTSAPYRKLDLLLTGALIEARSCERFALLAPRFGPGAEAPELHAIGQLYSQLERSEARHFELYLLLARSRFPHCWEARLRELAAGEASLATAPDPQFRFHSGTPAQTPALSP